MSVLYPFWSDPDILTLFKELQSMLYLNLAFLATDRGGDWWRESQQGDQKPDMVQQAGAPDPETNRPVFGRKPPKAPEKQQPGQRCRFPGHNANSSCIPVLQNSLEAAVCRYTEVKWHKANTSIYPLRSTEYPSCGLCSLMACSVEPCLHSPAQDLETTYCTPWMQ